MTEPATRPPEFFVDRSLGTTVTSGLRSRGWVLVDLADIYPDDARMISDTDWIGYGTSRGWPMLSKDKRIRRSPAYHAAGRPIFALSDGNLGLNAMIQLFDQHREEIWAAGRTEAREFWLVYTWGVQRRHP